MQIQNQKTFGEENYVGYAENSYSTGREKVTESTKSPSMKQRLILAILSLILLLIMFCIVLFMFLLIRIDFIYPPIQIFFYLISILFFAATIVINIIFNRK